MRFWRQKQQSIEKEQGPRFGTIQIAPNEDLRWRIEIYRLDHERTRESLRCGLIRLIHNWQRLEVPGNDEGFATTDEARVAYDKWIAFISQEPIVLRGAPQATNESSAA
jgi:hypothetical protein